MEQMSAYLWRWFRIVTSELDDASSTAFIQLAVI